MTTEILVALNKLRTATNGAGVDITFEAAWYSTGTLEDKWTVWRADTEQNYYGETMEQAVELALK